MRKVLLVGFATLVVVLASVFCISWFTQSGEMKRALEQRIAKLNEKQTYITYERIDVSGFPAQIALSIVNPHFSGRVDELLKSLQPDESARAANTLPEWYEDFALAGAVTFTVNALSDHYTLALTGEWKKSAKLAGKDIAAISSQSSGGSLCSLKLARSALLSNFWSYKITEENAADFLKEIRELDCNTPAYSIVESQSGTILVNSGETRFYVAVNPSGNNQEVRLYARQRDAEVSPAGEKFIKDYFVTLNPDYPYPLMLSIYGKQNFDMNLTLNLPTNIPHTSDANMDINLSEFSISNEIYNTRGHLRFTNQIDSEKRTSSLDTRTESTYSDAYDMVLKDTVRGIIKSISTCHDPECQSFRTMLQPRTPDEAYALIEPAIPNISSLGTQVFSVKAAYTGASNFSAGDYSLSDLAITFTPYGITGTGTAKPSASSPFPQANINLVCTNCMQLIDDAMHYAARVSGVIQSFSAEPQPFLITPSLIEATKKFFHALSGSTPEEKKNGHFSYSIISDPVAGGLTISGRNLGDIMAMYNEHVGQTMEAPAESIPPQGWKVN